MGRGDMVLIADLHTHSIASGHAYSTIRENIQQAAMIGLRYYGISDHTPGMRDTTVMGYFHNLRVLKSPIEKVEILKGAEANIVSRRGTIDLPAEIASRLDYVIASLHDIVIENMGIVGNTEAVIGAMHNPHVRIIGHPDDSRYPLHYPEIARAAKETGVALELNNSSLSPASSRVGGMVNAKELLEQCAAVGASVVVNSDSHIWYDVGNFIYAKALLDELRFPEHLVLNASASGMAKLLGQDRSRTYLPAASAAE